MRPRIGVVVVTYRSAAHLPRLKAALEAQTRPPDALIVWDNASPGARPTPDDLPAGAILVACEENLGFAAGNNRAVERLDVDLVVLLNPDAFPAPDWLARLEDAAARWPQAAAFGSTQLAAEKADRYDGLGDCYHVAGVPWRGGYGWPRSTAARTGAVFSPCAAAAMYRIEAWRAAGGFDERLYSYCEDVDLGFRLRLMGHECVQVADAIVEHVGGGSSGQRSPFAVRHGTRNRMWVYLKNMPLPLLILTLPLHLAVTATFLAVSPFRGTGPATWAGVGDALAGLPALFAARARAPKRRGALARLLAVMAWSPIALATRAPVVRAIGDADAAAKSR